MACPRGLPFLIAALGLGCSTRSLDPNVTGTGGDVVMTGSGGATGDGGVSVDAIADGVRPRPDALIETLPPPRCGNGVLDPGEQCDDGNLTPGDGCSSLCQLTCWDCTGGCGDGGTCLQPVCGDGVLAPLEACDDGNNKGGDGCAADCASIEPGWYCPAPGRRCVPVCGDRLVVGSETCDDGNAIAGDGCSDFCLVEPTTARCGDGVIEGAEACDDGGANNDTTYGVACTSQCRYAAYCGDGVVNGLEQCDNGSRMNNVTYGNMSGCGPGCLYPHYCGDGILDEAEGEQCDLGADNGLNGGYCTRDCKILI